MTSGWRVLSWEYLGFRVQVIYTYIYVYIYIDMYIYIYSRDSGPVFWVFVYPAQAWASGSSCAGGFKRAAVSD